MIKYKLKDVKQTLKVWNKNSWRFYLVKLAIFSNKCKTSKLKRKML